jgi:aminopeptidase N
MENASAIFYSDRAFRRGTLGRGLIAHETAHQWFGDAVTEREWAHVWLSEGFATYWAALDTQHAAGDSAFRADLRRLRDEVTGSPVVAARPVIDTAQTNHLELLNANSYQKGGWTLHMLRGLLGDSAFFRGVRAYYLTHRHGTALTDDLRAALESASGRPLDWFFDQWLRRPGFPELTVAWRYDSTAQRVRLTVRQGERFGAYRFPLDVELVAADGRPYRVTVDVPAEREVTLPLDVPLAAPPSSVRLDPDVRLLAKFLNGM